MTRIRLRVAIIGDTHGYLDPRIAEEVRQCDYAVHAGDIGSAGVLDAMAPREGEVLAVAGNNDVPSKWPQGDRDLLHEIPREVALALPGGEVRVTHGDRLGPVRGRHERLRARFAGARAVVYGHSHRLVVDQERLPWILNPGAAGRSRTYGGPSMLILMVGGGDWQVEIRQFATGQKGRKL